MAYSLMLTHLAMRYMVTPAARAGQQFGGDRGGGLGDVRVGGQCPAEAIVNIAVVWGLLGVHADRRGWLTSRMVKTAGRHGPKVREGLVVEAVESFDYDQSLGSTAASPLACSQRPGLATQLDEITRNS